MENQSTPCLSIEQVRHRLQVPLELLSALLNSGLLGHWSQGQVPLSSVENYEKYGTQWRSELGERVIPLETYSNITVLPEPQGGQQPPGTLFFSEIIPENLSFDSIAKDTGWLAQFYLKPNRFFFPSPTALALNGPVPLKLNAPKIISASKLPTCLYPSPDGSLAMVSILGNPKPLDRRKPFEVAFDIASPLLDQLSVDFDQPLPIAQVVIIGIPSGMITTLSPSFTASKTIGADDMLLASCPHPELGDAFALYREGISSNNPFHSFLTLWKVYENACKVRGEWRKKNKSVDIKLTQEIFSNKFAFEGYIGLTFDQAKQKLNAPYRVALAHGNAVKSGPKTAASASDFVDVSMKIPIIRYMARVCLENTRATLDTTLQAT
jgi:hypothetical protein